MEKYIGYHFDLSKMGSNSDAEVQTDILIAQLSELDFEGFQQSDLSLEAYIPEQLNNPEKVAELVSGHSDFEIPFRQQAIEPQNWNAVWEANFEPVVIANRVSILAPHHTRIPNIEYEITLEPKMSFGTGHHETTRLLIRAMLELEFDGKKVLDMGSGTGILSILASMMGAKNTDAIDIEEWAYTNCLENLEINNVKNANAILGDESKIPEATYPIILANINKGALKTMLPVLSEKTAISGTLVIGGILLEDQKEMIGLAAGLNLSLTQQLELNDWAGLVFIKTDLSQSR